MNHREIQTRLEHSAKMQLHNRARRYDEYHDTMRRWRRRNFSFHKQVDPAPAPGHPLGGVEPVETARQVQLEIEQTSELGSPNAWRISFNASLEDGPIFLRAFRTILSKSPRKILLRPGNSFLY